MSEFKYIYGSSLQHWGKGKQADDHKYTAREWVKGKWQYVYDKANKAGNLVKDSVSKTIGVDQRKAYKNAEVKASRDRLNAYKANKSYVDNRYTDSEYRRDLQKRGYTPKDKVWDREYTERSIRDTYNYGNKPENKKQFDDFRSSPESAREFRYFDAKLSGDKARKERAEKLAKQSVDSYKEVESSKLEYDKTLLGKLEKGYQIIDSILNISHPYNWTYKNDEYMKNKEKEYKENRKAYDDDALKALENLKKISQEYENTRLAKIANQKIKNIESNMSKESSDNRDYWNWNEVAMAIDMDKWMKKYANQQELDKYKNKK